MTAFDATYSLSRDIQKAARLHNELETLNTSIMRRKIALRRMLMDHERKTGDPVAIEMNDVFFTLTNQGELLIRERVGPYGLKSTEEEPETPPKGDNQESDVTITEIAF